MKRRWRCCLAAAVLSALFMLEGCSASLSVAEETLPEETLEKFEDAINTNDTQAMLDCLCEDAVDAIEATLDVTLSVTGALLGVDLDKYGLSASNMMDLLPLMQSMMPGLMVTSDTGTVDYEATMTLIKGSKATVYYTELNSGESGFMNMVKEDGDWLLSLDVTALTQDEADRVIVAETEEESAESDDGNAGTAEGLDSSSDAGTLSSVDSDESVGETESDAAAAVTVVGDDSDAVEAAEEEETDSQEEVEFSVSILFDEDAFNAYIEQNE